MRKISLVFIALFFTSVPLTLAGAEPTLQAAPSPTPAEEEKNSQDLFSAEGIYTLNSDFRHDTHDKLGDGDSVYSDFSYDHRFSITGKWYLRLGAEYERFDFGGTDNGLPRFLQAAYAHLAYEYVVHDHAGASIEIDPGVYWQDHISGDAFDIPWKMFVSFPLKKDKVFGVIGVGGALYQDPIVAPGGGIIWLFSDKFRLEGVFPKPALVYEITDDLQFRIQGNLFYQSYRTDNVTTREKKLQLHNAVVQYNEDRAGVEMRFTGFKPFKLIAGAGYTVTREFDFFRAHERAKLDPAPYFQLGLDANF
jgi:Domain of unknown function (DUF6268)